jgi:hypothetical protein
VLTNLNVQHLESLNDAVEELTADAERCRRAQYACYSLARPAFPTARQTTSTSSSSSMSSGGFKPTFIPPRSANLPSSSSLAADHNSFRNACARRRASSRFTLARLRLGTRGACIAVAMSGRRCCTLKSPVAIRAGLTPTSRATGRRFLLPAATPRRCEARPCRACGRPSRARTRSGHHGAEVRPASRELAACQQPTACRGPRQSRQDHQSAFQAFASIMVRARRPAQTFRGRRRAWAGAARPRSRSA